MANWWGSKGARIGLKDLKKSKNPAKFGFGLGSQILFVDVDFPSHGLDQLIQSSSLIPVAQYKTSLFTVFCLPIFSILIFQMSTISVYVLISVLQPLLPAVKDASQWKIILPRIWTCIGFGFQVLFKIWI